VNFGLFCSTPSVPLLRNVPAKQAMEMLLTGDFISAEQALGAGWSTAWWRRAAGRRSGKLVTSILAKPRVALAMGKALFYRQREMGTEAAYQLAGQTMAVQHDGRKRARGREGLH
jgi:enoyl-CoA hydratase/carnithine racemase